MTLTIVPFREIRHHRSEDAIHYEPIKVRGDLHEWRIPDHRHEDLHQFQLLTRGSLVGTLDGVRHTLCAPMALMIPPGVVHGFDYEPDSEGQQITVPSAQLGELAARPVFAQAFSRYIIVPADLLAQAPECEQLFEQVGVEFAGNLPGRTEALLAYTQLIALWFVRRDTGQGIRSRGTPLRDSLVHRFRRLVEEHFPRQRQIAFYADALGVTADHLSRACRQSTGLGALQLLHGRVEQEARRLLAYTPATIADIAEELGFADPSHFSRFFARAAGQSPTAYRNAAAAGQLP